MGGEVVRPTPPERSTPQFQTRPRTTPSIEETERSAERGAYSLS